MGYEKFVMDLDHCGMMLKMAGGFQVNDETLAREAYAEAGPGENFLASSHTLRHFAQANYLSELGDAGPYEQWLEDGSPDTQQRANKSWKQLLEQYEAPALDPAVDEALLDFMARKKSAVADAWY